MKEIKIKILSIDKIKEHLDDLLNYVSIDRLNKYMSYKKENDKLLTLGAGYFIKKYVSSDGIYYNEFNKPLVKNSFFNLSHSNKYVVFIKYDKECGIDIEEVKDETKEIAKFSFEETILDSMDFYYHWTLKESLCKCVGSGINLDNFRDIKVNEGYTTYQDNKYYLNTIVYNNYFISLCIKDEEPFVIKVEDEIINQ
jgi:phosphopantetheinyl transferase (holo-ACP synthase)